MQLSRRDFVRKSALAGAALTATALSSSKVLGANERVRVGVIGYGLIGRIHCRAFKQHSDAEIVALAEVYKPRMEAGAQFIDNKVAQHTDFRRMLDDKSIDAVVVATPDHWHAMQTMLACAAGKDVMVEKPTTLFVKEGRWMLDVAKRHKRVVAVGTQNRSGPNFQRARDLIRAGKIGQVVSIQNTYMRNVLPGFGAPADSAPPPEIDYDMWLGPAPQRPYNPNRAIYHFRWFWDYSGGQMTNLGQHSLDLVHWVMGVKFPKSIYATGGRKFIKDNCEVPDTQDSIAEYDNATGADGPSGPGFTAISQYRECSNGRAGTGMGGLTFHGTMGTLSMSRQGFLLTGDPKVHPNNTVAAIIGGHPVGGPQANAALDREGEKWTQDVEDKTGDAPGDYTRHARNFLDCIKSRQNPVSDLQSGHEVAATCHLTNISMKTARKLVWDPQKEEIVNDAEANAMLTRPYRQPWDAELRALIG